MTATFDFKGMWDLITENLKNRGMLGMRNGILGKGFLNRTLYLGFLGSTFRVLRQAIRDTRQSNLGS